MNQLYGPKDINLLGLSDRLVKHYRKKSNINLEKIIKTFGTISVISSDKSLINDPFHNVE